MSGVLNITLGNRPQSYTISTDRKAPVGTLQAVWDTKSDAEKNTFADANRAEILTFIDVLLMNELTDGASITVDCDSEDQIMFYLSTAQSTPTLDISNFGNVASIAIQKTIAGDVTATLSGTGYKFVDLDSDNDTVAATVDITLSGASNSHYEINLIDSGIDNAGDDVLNVTSKL